MGRALAAWVMLAAGVAGPAASPSETVRTALSRLAAVVEPPGVTTPALEVPRDTALARRRAEVRRVVEEFVDVEEIARRTLPRQWPVSPAADRREFVRVYATLLEQTYVPLIERWARERIVVTGESVQGRHATVAGRVEAGGRRAPVEYRLHRLGGRWKIYDVVVAGQSALSPFRQDFARLGERRTLHALVEEVRRQATAR